jgi:hypothetical protein
MKFYDGKGTGPVQRSIGFSCCGAIAVVIFDVWHGSAAVIPVHCGQTSWQTAS